MADNYNAPYIMETQDPRELWLVDGENKFKISRDMYLLLASNGADMPPTNYIKELMAENAKYRESIVHCCDCENIRGHYEGMDVYWCGYLHMYVGSDCFCCWGNRRDEDTIIEDDI